MWITANRNACISSGMCVLTAPEVFDQHEQDGLVTVLVPDPPQELHEHVSEAVRLCPSRALSIQIVGAGDLRAD